jgi:threonylcarbamoyladenosine tRNA methylthiotransferase MtaB
MRRRYTPEQFTDSVRYALERLPDLGLGTDVITGFPGEDDAAFEATRTLLESLPFSNIHVFPYSERPGTPAAEMTESVPVHLRRERARELLRLAERKRQDFAARFVGREVEVLVERRDANGIGRGWTGEYVETRIANCPPEAVGQVLKVTPDSATEGKLLTTVAPEASAAP